MSVIYPTPTAPTVVRYAKTYVAYGETTHLFWEGAVGKPTITHYDLQQSKSTDGVTWGVWHNTNESASTDEENYLRFKPSSNLRIVNGHTVETYYVRHRIRAVNETDLGTYVSDWAVVERPLRTLSGTQLSEWTLDKTTADAGDVVNVTITQTYQVDYITAGTGYTHKVTASFNGHTAEATMDEFATACAFELPLSLLKAIPDDVTCEGTVSVDTYREGDHVGTSAQAFTLTCPYSVKPTLSVAVSRVLTVDGVTYPDVTGGYVQHKSAVKADITFSGGTLGSYIVSHHIQVAERLSEGYNVDASTLTTALLEDAGQVPITFTVTDSRGRTATKTEYITVVPYSPPQATFRAWRVNESGEVDVQGTLARYEYSYTFSDLGGLNTCTTSLTAAGKTAQDVPETGDLLPGNPLTFAASTTYSAVLTLTDAYGPVLFASVLPSQTGTVVTIRPAKPREKRRMIFGDYDTANDGLWTLTGWSCPEPEYQANTVSVPGRHGLLDFSTVLTDGEPVYGNRTLAATFESSEGTREERNDRISHMVNALDGRRVKITLPDDRTRYLVGRVSVRTEYSDPVHAAVAVTVDCEPWRYSVTETGRVLEATDTEQVAVIVNNGRRRAVPVVTVAGEWVRLTCGGHTWTLYGGTYTLPDLNLPQGKTTLTYNGQGTATITYREAML